MDTDRWHILSTGLFMVVNIDLRIYLPISSRMFYMPLPMSDQKAVKCELVPFPFIRIIANLLGQILDRHLGRYRYSLAR
jgi:hypothetical protein